MMPKNEKGNVILRIIRETNNYYHLLVLTTLSTIILSVNRLIVTNFLGKMVDTSIGHGLNLAVEGFYYLLGGILALAAVTWLNKYLIGKYKQKCLYTIREKTIKSVQELPLSSIERYTTGELLSRMNNDMGLVASLFDIIPDTFYKVLLGSMAAVYGFTISWKLTLLVLLVPLFLALINYYVTKPIQSKQRELQDILGKVTQLCQDAISGHVEIKAFGLYDWIKNKYDKLVDLSIKKAIEIARIVSVTSSMLDSIAIGLQIAVVFMGLYLVLNNEMTLGSLVIFQQIQGILHDLFRIDFLGFRKSAAGLDRLFELWDAEKERASGNVKEGAPGAPVLSFENVAFSYKSKDEQKDEQGEIKKTEILKGISFDIKKNESVALVGPSGCGKTTIIKLACGFVRCDSGEVYYKGFLYDDWETGALRHGISLVDQNTYLFPTTIYDNIACGIYGDGNVKVDQAAVEKSAELANLRECIDSLDKGYLTEVGEWGAKLSGGQKQRIAIARALLKNSDFLILDEPTSALDAKSEIEVQRTIEKLMSSRTALIVAHRLSTIRNVDRILVLNNGQIVEEGNYDALIERKGMFYRLYQKQLRQEQE